MADQELVVPDILPAMLKGVSGKIVELLERNLERLKKNPSDSEALFNSSYIFLKIGLDYRYLPFDRTQRASAFEGIEKQAIPLLSYYTRKYSSDEFGWNALAVATFVASSHIAEGEARPARDPINLLKRAIELTKGEEIKVVAHLPYFHYNKAVILADSDRYKEALESVKQAFALIDKYVTVTMDNDYEHLLACCYLVKSYLLERLGPKEDNMIADLKAAAASRFKRIKLENIYETGSFPLFVPASFLPCPELSKDMPLL